jgi:hypothetical protein
VEFQVVELEDFGEGAGWLLYQREKRQTEGDRCSYRVKLQAQKVQALFLMSAALAVAAQEKAGQGKPRVVLAAVRNLVEAVLLLFQKVPQHGSQGKVKL